MNVLDLFEQFFGNVQTESNFDIILPLVRFDFLELLVLFELLVVTYNCFQLLFRTLYPVFTIFHSLHVP